MKKKALAVLSALVIMAMGTVTAFAADSPSGATVQNPVSTQTATTSVATTEAPATYAAATSAESYEVTAVSDNTVSQTKVAAQNELLNDLATTGTNLGNDTIKNAATNGSKVTATILTVVDVTPDTATPDANGNYTVTLKNASVKAGDIIAILHWNGTKWETIKPSSVVDGAVTFTVSNLSPISIVKLDVAAVTTAPKTGEAAPIAAAFVVIALLGAAVAGKKYFA